MNKVAFVMSSFLALLGVLLLAWGQAVKALLPKIGYLVFKASGPGSYSPSGYAVNLSGFHGVAIVSLVVGIALSVVFYRAGRGETEQRE